jgi:hypothetical protein
MTFLALFRVLFPVEIPLDSALEGQKTKILKFLLKMDFFNGYLQIVAFSKKF